MKKAVVAVLGSMVLGWSGGAMADSYFSDLYYSEENTGLSAPYSRSYGYDFSATFSPEETVAWAELTLFFSDILVIPADAPDDYEGYFEENEHVVVTINGTDRIIDGSLASIPDNEYGYIDGAYLFYFDITSYLNESPELDVKIKATKGVFEIGGLIVDGETMPVPEPSTLILFGIGLTGAAALGRRKFLS